MYKFLPKLLSLTIAVILLTPSVAFAFGQQVFDGIVNGFFGLFVGLGGWMLNIVITEYVVGFGQQYKEILGDSVEHLWTLVRDLVNLTFIFGLVYIGFKMIFDSESSDAKKMLAKIIIAALFINFSLFITKFVIDVSNITATQFAEAFVTGTGSTREYDVSDAFAKLLNISSIHGSDGKIFNDEVGDDSWGFILGKLIVYLSLIFAFFSGTFILAIRFLVLNLYMIFSPLLFIGFIFPNLMSFSKKMWENFLEKAFTAPVYLLLLYISYSILSSLMSDVETGAANNRLFGNGDGFARTPETFAQPFLNLFFVAGMLIASVIIAQKLGAEGANKAMSLGKSAANKTRQYAQRKSGDLTAGGLAKAGRISFGYGASKLANNDGLNKWAAKSKIGKAALLATHGVADASFDVRQVGGLGKSMGIGEGKKGGFKTRVKEKKTADQEFAKKLKKTTVRDKNGNYVSKEMEERVNNSVAKEENTEGTVLHGRKVQMDTKRNKYRSEVEIIEGDERKREELAKHERDLLTATSSRERTILKNRIALLERDINDNKNKVNQSKTDAKEWLDARNSYKQEKSNKTASVESSITYENQINFTQKLESTAQWQNKLFVTAPLAKMTTESAENLKKRYGADGSKGKYTEEEDEAHEKTEHLLHQISNLVNKPHAQPAPQAAAADGHAPASGGHAQAGGGHDH